MASMFTLPSSSVQVSRPENAKEEEEGPSKELPQELTSSTALAMWYSMMQKVIMDGKPLNETDTLGYSFLHYAALEGNIEVIEMLLENGVNINYVAENHQQIQPLHWAALRGNTEVIVLLSDKGADVNACESEGHTPLMKSAQYGQTDAVMTLIARGAQLDTLDNHGHTALHWAAYMGRPLTVECLIRFGADFLLKDGEGMTPLHRATQQCQGGHLDIAILLLKKGSPIEFTKLSEEHTDMGHLSRTSRGHMKKMIHDIVSGGSADGGLVPVVFCKKLGTKGDYFYHNIMCQTAGKAPNLYAVFIIGAINCFIAYFHYFLPVLHLYTNLHYLGFACATISVVSYIACTQVDPGFISTDTTDEEARIKKDMAMSGCAKGKICTSCNIRKPLRSKHCSRCGRCVSRFDHHCPWIGNCVGYRNLPIFVTFLTSSTIAGVIFAGFTHVRANTDDDAPLWNSVFAPLYYIWFFITHMPYLMVVSSYTTTLTIYFALMCFFHIKQCISNITTNEMENAWRFPYLMRDKVNPDLAAGPLEPTPGVVDLTSKEFFNPFDRGVVLNCVESFGRPGLQLLSRSGQVGGSDGHTRSCPGVGFPDYFRITSLEEIEPHSIPTYREMLSIRGRNTNGYDSVKTAEDQA
eukprot:CAMPEP_0180134536 /NCGR_PEP_ID=MMETSP0986-20121125/10223_1 /TAXON_ID=697907 /ORGANISM="non described non described, Strain CCMP2293" /LENGTH=634 /DNA_ID=CAMNT_0022074921 /DNA_START=39 /DNA_END=1943 /DNA_ORIENTATION=+